MAAAPCSQSLHQQQVKLRALTRVFLNAAPTRRACEIMGTYEGMSLREHLHELLEKIAKPYGPKASSKN